MKPTTKAYHEAGHAVAAIVLCSGRITTVSIRPNKTFETRGHVLLNHVRLVEAQNINTPQEEWSEMVLRNTEMHVMIFLAGEAAQRLHSPRSVRLWHSLSDWEKAMEMLRLVIPEADIHARSTALMQATKELLQKNWAAVQAVAALLIEREELPGDEVEYVVREIVHGEANGKVLGRT